MDCAEAFFTGMAVATAIWVGIGLFLKKL